MNKKVKIALFISVPVVLVTVPLIFLLSACNSNKEPEKKQPVVVKEAKIAASLIDPNLTNQVTAAQASTVINNEWLFNNRDKILSGSLDLIKTVDDLQLIDFTVNPNNTQEGLLSFEIAANKTYLADGQINSQPTKIEMTLTNFRIIEAITSQSVSIAVNDLDPEFNKIIVHTAQSIINNDWIIANKAKLLRGTLDLFNAAADVKNLSLEINGSQTTKANLRFDVAAQKSYLANGQINNSPVTITIELTGFESTQPITIKALELDASTIDQRLNDKITAAMASPIVNAQWIINNKTKLLNGSLELLTKASDIQNLNFAMDAQERNKANLSFTVAAQKSFTNQGTINPNEVPINFKLSGFKIVDPISRLNDELTVSEIDASITDQMIFDQAQNTINLDWIIAHKNQLLKGTLDLLVGPTDLDNFQFSVDPIDTTKANLRFQIKPQKSYLASGLINEQGVDIELKLTGFRRIEPIQPKNADLNITTIDQSLTSEMIVHQARATITKDWVIVHKNDLLSGTLNKLVSASDLDQLSFEPDPSNTAQAILKFTVLGGKSYQPDGQINSSDVEISIILTGFRQTDATSPKANEIVANTVDNQIGLDKIVYQAQNIINQAWVLANKNKLLNGTLDLFTSIDDVLDFSFAADETDTTKAHLNFKIAANKTFLANGQLNNQPQAISITLTEFKITEELNLLKSNFDLIIDNLDPDNWIIDETSAAEGQKIINPGWIIRKASQIFNGTFVLVEAQDILDLATEIIVDPSLNPGDDGSNSTLKVSFKIAANKTLLNNGQLNPDQKEFSFTISSFLAVAQVNARVSSNIPLVSKLDPQLAGKTIAEAENIIDNQWIVDHKDQLLRGSYHLLTSANDVEFKSLSAIQGNNANADLTFKIAAGKSFQDNGQFAGEREIKVRLRGFTV